MADMVTKQELEAAKIDVKNAGEAVNEKKIVNPRYGAAFKSLPLVSAEAQAKADEIVAQGFYKSYATETALKASLPAVSEMRARADDTRKIWRWNRTSAEGVVPVTGTWTDTGLSDKDIAAADATTKANAAEANAKIYSDQNISDIKAKNILTLADLTVINNTPSLSNGVLSFAVVSGYSWGLFATEINEIKFTAQTYTRLINFGKNSLNEQLFLDIGTATLGRVYALTTSTIKTVTNLDITGKTGVSVNEAVRVSIADNKLKVIVVRSNIEVELFNVDILQFTSSFQLGFGTLNTTTLAVAKDVVLINNKYQKSVSKIDFAEKYTADKFVKQKRKALLSDLTLVQGDSFSYLNDKLTLVKGGTTPVTVVQFAKNIKQVELTALAGFYGLTIGRNSADGSVAVIGLGISATRTVADIVGTSFNTNSYGLNGQTTLGIAWGSVPATIAVGDRIRATIENKDTVLIEIARVGSSDFTEHLRVNRKMTNLTSAAITGWDEELQLGVCCISGTQTLAENVLVTVEEKTTIDGFERKSIDAKFAEIDYRNLNRWKGKKWLAIGDSITEAYKYYAEGYQATVDRLLNFSQYYSRGYSGKTVVEINALKADWEKDANLITVYAGVNDYLFQRPKGAVGVYDNTTTYGAMMELLNYLGTENPTASICVVLPARLWGYTTSGTKQPDNMTNAGTSSSSGITPLIDYVNILREAAREFGAPTLDLFTEYAFNKHNIAAYTYDGLHPNRAGHEKLGYQFGRFLINQS
ncbi:SGNH/GDSL hydrolase family protein [Acinetobacter terrestris]|uniref:GDSL-type esterase/lipase family protein n=1 Tax=Acinetobacter terrestris TaxID=2529843 RepID=A0AAW6UUY8_9GAMM|nr:GDSL-type esterase/lipase family protein [Acinetobacter terrestris]MDK1683464.1 GDSL-type esterase/lipase family protein [Acinetobacter terrestris]